MAAQDSPLHTSTFCCFQMRPGGTMAFSRASVRKIREILRLHLQAGFPQGHLVRLCPIPPSGRPSRMGGWIPSAWQAQSSSAARAWPSAVPAGISACSRTPLSPLVAIARWTRTPSRAYRDRSGAMMVSRMRKDGQQRAWLALTWDSRRQCAHDDQNPSHRAGFHSSHAQAPP